MASYGYMTRGYSSYNGIGSQADVESRPMYTEYECSDHVCRPVIVDAEGRKQPNVAYTPNYVGKTERIVEHVRIPLVVYKHSYPTDDYGGNHDRREPSSPNHNRLPLVDKSINKVQSDISQPSNRPGFLSNKNWHASPRLTGHNSPVGYDNSNNFSNKELDKANGNTIRNEYYDDYTKGNDRIMEPSMIPNGKTERIVEHARTPLVEYKHSYPTDDYEGKHNRRDPSSPNHNRLPLVEESITNVQSEVSRPNTRPGFLSSTNRHASPHLTSHNSPAGYDNSDNFSNKELNKPSGNIIRNEYYDDYTKGNDRIMEPYMIPYGSRLRPNHAGLAVPPSQNTKLAKATNDITTAMEYLNAGTKPSYVPAALPQPRFSDQVPRKDTYTDTIDSREAAKRYGNFSLSSRPLPTGETFATTIDSREAMRKYGGAIV